MCHKIYKLLGDVLVKQGSGLGLGLQRVELSFILVNEVDHENLHSESQCNQSMPEVWDILFANCKFLEMATAMHICRPEL